ncbi:hypothetical protein JOM56_002706 [Amanita muscaria]
MNIGSSVAFTTPSKSSVSFSSSHRLLYRGALCLPDSHLTLDGITFCARIDTTSEIRSSSHTPNSNNDNSLLENPLALALETMRGRPTLRFMSTVKLSSIWMDESGGILMDIHPNATLTRIYFENLFCLGMSANKAMEDVFSSLTVSELGVKVALGDTDGPETTYIVIFARLNEQDSSEAKPQLQLVVARLTARPPDPRPRPRLPRPDDPIPRKPPLLLVGSKVRQPGIRELRSVGSSGELDPIQAARELKRVASIGNGLSNRSKRQKLEVCGQGGDGKARFKVPQMPSKTAHLKGKGNAQSTDTDVFGLNVVNGDTSHTEDGNCRDGEIERTNKNVIKKATLDFLAKTKDPCRATFVNRSHPEFKEIFQWVYRGVSFALRVRIKDAPLEPATIQRLVAAHAEMYVGGHGTSKNPVET